MRHQGKVEDNMPVNCGSEAMQTITLTENSPLQAAEHALDVAGALCWKACESEKCSEGNCSYTQSKMVGKTVHDLATKKWTSTQTSSGKCSCKDEGAEHPCKMEIEQTVVEYGDNPLAPSDKAREIARRNAQQACKVGKCSKKSKMTCEYEEKRIEGETKMDSATGKYVSTQTTIGRCRCISDFV